MERTRVEPDEAENRSSLISWKTMISSIAIVLLLGYSSASIGYDIGVGNGREESVRLEEKVERMEVVVNDEKQRADGYRDKSLRCNRATDFAAYRLSYVADVLADFHNADSQEELDAAKARSESWYNDRTSNREELDKFIQGCIDG